MSQYAYSTDGERYDGRFDSEREAAIAAFADTGEYQVEVSIIEPVSNPESYVNSWDVLEAIQCQEEYSMDGAENWPNATADQNDELTDMLRKTVAKWLDKHNLRPTFFVCSKPVTFYRKDFEK